MFYFSEQEVDGEGLMEMDTALLKEFIPCLTLGKCLTFFRRLEKFRKPAATRASSIPPIDSFHSSCLDSTSSSVQSLSLPDNLTSSPLADTSAPFDSSSSAPSQSSHQPQSIIISSPSPLLESASVSSPSENITTTPRQSKTVAAPGEFPIRQVVFSPVAMQMIKTGVLSRTGKAAVTEAVATKLLKLSVSSWYGALIKIIILKVCGSGKT